MCSKHSPVSAWRRLSWGWAAAWLLYAVLPGAVEGEDGRWVWGRNNRRNQKYATGGIDDGLLSPGAGGGVLGGDGVKFGLRPGAYGPGGVGGYKPAYPRPEPPPVHEGPQNGFGGPARPPILAGPGGPTFGGPGFVGPGIGGLGIGGPGIGGPGIGGPGIGGPGIGGPGIGGPGIGGPGIGGPGGPGLLGPGGPGIGGPGGPGGRPGILTGPVPSWEQERLDAHGIGHRYHSFETCKCVHSFNCKSPGLTFGKCDKDKQYCCNGIRPGAVGHGVRKPHLGEGYPPPPPGPGGFGPGPGGFGPGPGGFGPGPGGFGQGPIGEPGFGPEPYPGGLGFERSAKAKKA